MKGHVDITDLPWFSEEAHFYLNAQVNKQKCRSWGSEQTKHVFREAFIQQTRDGLGST